MADLNNRKQLSENGDYDMDRSSTILPPSAAFTGYRPFPAVVNLYSNASGVLNALKTQKLCGATENDFLYLVEAHFGFTPRGPLHFGPGYYLRNGVTIKDPILAATGSEFPLPFLVQLFDPKTSVKLPPLDQEKSPRDMVTEVLHASKSKELGVAFRFAIEVGVKTKQREEFEWRKVEGHKQEDENEKGTGTRYKLHRLAAGSPSVSGPSFSSSSPTPVDDTKVVADLLFRNVLNLRHPFTLELKGAGLTGELGERWALMVVMTSLSLHFLRQYGKTNKATVGAAQKLHSK
jgi:hypothetical protein